MSISSFSPAAWAPALAAQLKNSLIFRDEPFIGPLPKPVRYTPVWEGSYLSAVIADELGQHVPYEEADEAAAVMIAALNEWIAKKEKS